MLLLHESMARHHNFGLKYSKSFKNLPRAFSECRSLKMGFV